MAQMIRREGKWIPLQPYAERCIFFSLTAPLSLFYKPSTRHLRSHLGSIYTLWRMISVRSELQFVCCVWGLLLQKNKCQMLAKGCRLQDSRLLDSKAESKKRRNKLYLPSFSSVFPFLSAIAGRERQRETTGFDTLIIWQNCVLCGEIPVTTLSDLLTRAAALQVELQRSRRGKEQQVLMQRSQGMLATEISYNCWSYINYYCSRSTQDWDPVSL